MTAPALRPLSFGEVLDGAFTLYRRNFRLFLLTSLLLTAGLVAAAFVIGGTGAAMASVMPGMMAVVVVLLVLVSVSAVAMALWGALTWQAAQSYVGKPVSLGEGIGAGGRSAMTLVGAAILGAVAFGVLMMGIVLFTSIFGAVVAVIGITALTLLVGFVSALGVLAAFFAVASLFFAVIPAVVLEEKGPFEAILRSLQLARGALPRVTGLMVVTLVMTYLPMLAVLLLTGGLEGMLNPQAAEYAAAGSGGMLVQQLLTWAVSLLTMPFLPCVMVLLYYDRRVRTEALDVQMLTDDLALAGA